MAKQTVRVGLALRTPHQQQLWTEVLGALGAEPVALRSPAPSAETDAVDLLVVDLAAAAQARLEPIAYGAALAARVPGGRWIGTLDTRCRIAQGERRFACSIGAADLLPMLVPRDPQCAAQVARALEAAELTGAAAPVEAYFSRARIPEPLNAVRGLLEAGTTPRAIADWMRSADGPRRDTRRYALKTYEDCFVGAEAVSAIASQYGLGRVAAVAIGELLLEMGVFRHVVKEHSFEDRELFYRFVESEPAGASADLRGLLERLWSKDGLEVAARSYRGKTYDACFVGEDAVDWFVRELGVSRDAGVDLGQSLIDLGLMHHVLDDHAFRDAHLFYRFRRHEL